MIHLLKAYNRLCMQHSVLAPAIQTGILMTTGDIIAQTLVEGRRFKDLNYVRTVQFGGLGLVMVGPAMAMWYKLLAKFVGTEGKVVALKKVALDQLIFAPGFGFIFLSTLGAVQGKDLESLIAHLKRIYGDIMLTNYKVWPWVQLFNFYVVPLHYQVLLVQSVAIFWNTYLSWKTQKE